MNLTTLSSPGAFYDDGLFWLALVLLIGLTWTLREAAVSLRSAAIVVTSVLVLSQVANVSLGSLVVLLAAIAWAYLCGKLARPFARERPNLAALLCSAPLLVGWGVGRFVSPGSTYSFLAFTGLSFLVVKLYTVSKDIADGAIEQPEPLNYAAYLLFFPCAPSGPMHRYEEFGGAMRAPAPPSGQDFTSAVYRLLLGCAKVKIVAPLLAPMSLVVYPDWHSLTQHWWGSIAVACVVYSIVLYVDFSGYTDIAIACARLIGIRAPENFRAPYLAQNIREFWQRWHITFTRVLTGYLFVPVSRELQGRGLRPRAVMIVAYFVTFGFCGFWHGAGWNMIAWGGYHAFGLIAFDLAHTGRARRDAAGSEYHSSVWRRAFATSITFGFVSAGWILFAIPFARRAP